MENSLLKALEYYCSVDEENLELCSYTDKGYNIILYVDSWDIKDVVKAIEQFDSAHEVSIWWNDDSFRGNYNESMREALDDMDDWKNAVLAALIGASQQKPLTNNDINGYLDIKRRIEEYAKSYFEQNIKESENMTFSSIDFLKEDFLELAQITYSYIDYNAEVECDSVLIPLDKFLTK